jgi:hypothetical protein
VEEGSMRGQVVVIAAYLAVILVVIVLFYEFIYILPLTTTRAENMSIQLDIERIIKSRINWTAKDLVEAIIREFNPSYVNVSIKAYNILMNDTLLYNDTAVYMPYNVSLSRLIKYYFVYTELYRNGYYLEYIIEVGFE